jgi:hypothetical protein
MGWHGSSFNNFERGVILQACDEVDALIVQQSLHNNEEDGYQSDEMNVASSRSYSFVSSSHNDPIDCMIILDIYNLFIFNNYFPPFKQFGLM